MAAQHEEVGFTALTSSRHLLTMIFRRCIALHGLTLDPRCPTSASLARQTTRPTLHTLVSRHYIASASCRRALTNSHAVETGTYTIVSTAPLSKQNQDVLVNGNDELRKLMPVGGGLTQIFDPEGRPLCKMPEPDVEAIIYAEVDRSNCLLARAALDTVGHYARKDVFQVHFDNTPRHAIVVGPHGQATGGHKTRRTRAEVFGELVPTSIAVEEEEL